MATSMGKLDSGVPKSAKEPTGGKQTSGKVRAARQGVAKTASLSGMPKCN